jgi:hypothetical protein
MTLNPRDFRVGNYLQDLNLNMVFMVVELTLKNMKVLPIIKLSLPPTTKLQPEAIPLDVKFFENIGFQYVDDVPKQGIPFVAHDNGMKIMVEHNTEGIPFFYWENQMDADLQLNYVHEFQNLWYVLTGADIVIQVSNS